MESKTQEFLRNRKPVKLKMSLMSWVGIVVGLAGLIVHSYSADGSLGHYSGLLGLVLGLALVINSQIRNENASEKPNK